MAKIFEYFGRSERIDFKSNYILYNCSNCSFFRTNNLIHYFFCEVVQPKVALQPINPLVELNYITVRKNQRLHQKQVLKKSFLNKSKRVVGYTFEN